MMNRSNLTKDNLVELIGELRHNIVNLNDSIEVLEKISNNFNIIHSNLYSFVESLEDEEPAQEEEPAEDTLRVGDYMSLPSENYRYNYNLYQLINIDAGYTWLDVDSLVSIDINYHTIEDLIADIPDIACIYRIDNRYTSVCPGEYLIYDSYDGSDYEVRVEYDKTANVFKVKLATCEDYLIEKDFNSLEELDKELKSTYSIVKKLRS